MPFFLFRKLTYSTRSGLCCKLGTDNFHCSTVYHSILSNLVILINGLNETFSEIEAQLKILLQQIPPKVILRLMDILWDTTSQKKRAIL